VDHEKAAAAEACLAVGSESKPAQGLGDTLSVTQRQVMDVLEQPQSLDQMMAQTKIPAGAIQADLTLLEVRGLVVRRGGLFVRRRSDG